MTSLSWRKAHAWLRGYSDGKAGRPQLAAEDVPFPDGEPQYSLGYFVGAGGLDEPALDTSGAAQCQV